MIKVFDFDGVISNSIDECYLTACLTFQGKSTITEEDIQLNNQFPK